MKTVGIIGGLGPETTAEFYLAVVFQCAQISHEHRPAILTWNVPIPYTIEEAALTRGTQVERYLPYLQEAAQRLEAGGADFLVMPCNTLHRFIEDIRSSVGIPVLSVIEAVVRFLHEKKIDEVGLVATGITLESGFYQRALSAAGIRMRSPDEFQQAKLAKMIFGLVTNRYANHQRHELLEVIDELDRQGARTILLACTDLQALVPHHPRLQILDTMQILVDSTVAEICELEPKSCATVMP
jgi:aspartate racemase